MKNKFILILLITLFSCNSNNKKNEITLIDINKKVKLKLINNVKKINNEFSSDYIEFIKRTFYNDSTKLVGNIWFNQFDTLPLYLAIEIDTISSGKYKYFPDIGDTMAFFCEDLSVILYKVENINTCDLINIKTLNQDSSLMNCSFGQFGAFCIRWVNHIYKRRLFSNLVFKYSKDCSINILNKRIIEKIFDNKIIIVNGLQFNFNSKIVKDSKSQSFFEILKVFNYCNLNYLIISRKIEGYTIEEVYLFNENQLEFVYQIPVD